jgi:hypothetical protein
MLRRVQAASNEWKKQMKLGLIATVLGLTGHASKLLRTMRDEASTGQKRSATGGKCWGFILVRPLSKYIRYDASPCLNNR